MSRAPDRAEFEAIYRQHFALSWRWLRRLGVPERDLADAAQEVFMVVARRLHEHDGRKPIAAWLYAICLRVASNRRRSAVSRNELLLDESASSEIHERAAPTATDQSDRRALLEDALALMSLEQRAVFTLFELEGYTGEEIAGLVGAPLPTVHSRLRLAREIFRRTVARAQARGEHELKRLGGER